MMRVWGRRVLRAAIGTLALSVAAPAFADPIHWTDWTAGQSVAGGFVATGTITTTTTTVGVTYTNPQGVGFFDAGGGVDYWVNSGGARNPANSPYTSAAVDNIPTGTDIIALQYAGSQSLTFSQTIANPVFSYVSLNVNGYGFLNQDFEILSFGDPSNGNACGYWGCGTSSKQVINLGGGNVEYRLVGTGEPHGTIRFLGAFKEMSRALLNFGGGSADDYATFSASFTTSPSC